MHCKRTLQRRVVVTHLPNWQITPEGQVIRMSYAKYPKEMKEAVIARMLQGDETVTDIQRDTGIGINTLPK